MWLIQGVLPFLDYGFLFGAQPRALISDHYRSSSPWVTPSNHYPATYIPSCSYIKPSVGLDSRYFTQTLQIVKILIEIINTEGGDRANVHYHCQKQTGNAQLPLKTTLQVHSFRKILVQQPQSKHGNFPWRIMSYLSLLDDYLVIAIWGFPSWVRINSLGNENGQNGHTRIIIRSSAALKLNIGDLVTIRQK